MGLIKKRRVDIRLSDKDFKKLSAISDVKEISKTAVIESLIRNEFNKSKEYSERFYNNL